MTIGTWWENCHQNWTNLHGCLRGRMIQNRAEFKRIFHHSPGIWKIPWKPSTKPTLYERIPFILVVKFLGWYRSMLSRGMLESSFSCGVLPEGIGEFITVKGTLTKTSPLRYVSFEGIYIYIPGTCSSSILGLQPSKRRPFPIKTGVIWVPGIYTKYQLEAGWIWLGFLLRHLWSKHCT